MNSLGMCYLFPRQADFQAVSCYTKFKAHSFSDSMQGWTVFHLASKLAHRTDPGGFLGHLLHCNTLLSYTDAQVCRSVDCSMSHQDHLVQCKDACLPFCCSKLCYTLLFIDV